MYTASNTRRTDFLFDQIAYTRIRRMTTATLLGLQLSSSAANVRLLKA